MKNVIIKKGELIQLEEVDIFLKDQVLVRALEDFDITEVTKDMIFENLKVYQNGELVGYKAFNCTLPLTLDREDVVRRYQKDTCDELPILISEYLISKNMVEKVRLREFQSLSDAIGN